MYKRLIEIKDTATLVFASAHCERIGATMRPVRTGGAGEYAIEGGQNIRRKIDKLVDQLEGLAPV